MLIPSRYSLLQSALGKKASCPHWSVWGESEVLWILMNFSSWSWIMSRSPVQKIQLNLTCTLQSNTHWCLPVLFCIQITTKCCRFTYFYASFFVYLCRVLRGESAPWSARAASAALRATRAALRAAALGTLSKEVSSSKEAAEVFRHSDPPTSRNEPKRKNSFNPKPPDSRLTD